MSAFPFSRSSTSIECAVASATNTDSFSEVLYRRRRSKEAVIFKSQFMEIDQRLQETFRYVAPAECNRAVYSVTFGGIIKNAANLFELGSRWLYPQLFDIGSVDLKIYSFLSLDKFTKASSLKLRSFQFYDTFSAQQIYEPFCSLAEWDREAPLTSANVPIWWTASNKLKHSNSGLQDHGTLENAISAVGASFAFLHAVFGPGLVHGVDIDEQGVLHNEATSSVFGVVY